MGFTKFKLLGERLLSGIGLNKTFFPIYDNQVDADFRVSLNTLITFISNELGVSSKAVFELTGVSNVGNDYVSTLDISSYKTEGLYIFKPSADSDAATSLDVPTTGEGSLPIKKFNGTSLVDVDDLKTVNTYVLLNKTTYWLIVGGASGGSGGSSTFEDLTDSPYDNTLLAEALDSKQDKSNGVLTGCIITLGSYGGGGSNNDIRVTEGTWRISPSEYGNVGSGNTDFLDIALSASGLQRFVDIVGTTSNTIIKVEGAESAIAVRPTLSAGQVSLGSILVKDALIDPPVPDLSGYVPLVGTSSMTGDILASVPIFTVGRGYFSRIDFYKVGDISNTKIVATNESDFNLLEVTFEGDTTATTAKASIKAVNFTDSSEREFDFLSNGEFNFKGDIAKYDADRTSEINAQTRALIDRGYADAKYALAGQGYSETVISANFTAANDKIYNVVANATSTDPTPVEGKGFTVFVRNATAIVGGISYAAGFTIKRVFHSGSWTNTSYYSASQVDTIVNAKVEDNLIASTTVAPSKTAVNTGLALKANLTANTFTGRQTIDGFSLAFLGINASIPAGVDGILRTASNVLSFFTNGSTKLRLNTTGSGVQLPLLTPSSESVMVVDTGGQVSSPYSTQTSEFTAGQISSAENVASWVDGIKTISGLKRGQTHYSTTTKFEYTCYTDNECSRLLVVDYDDVTTIPRRTTFSLFTSSFTLAIGSTHICNGGSQLLAALPSTSSIGDEIEVVGMGSGGWRITQAVGQSIAYNNTTTTSGTGGYVQSNANRYASVRLRCIVANTQWVLVSNYGALTFN